MGKRLAEGGRMGNAAGGCRSAGLKYPRTRFRWVGEFKTRQKRDNWWRMEKSTYPLPEPLITATPERLGGEPVFAGTRVPVKTLFDYIEDGAPLSEFLDGFPNVSREHAVAVLELAKTTAIAESTGIAAE